MIDCKYFVYRYIRLDKNEPFYIGIGTHNILHKRYKRAEVFKHSNIIWQRITEKSKYEIDIIFESNDYEEVKLKEIGFIKIYGRINKKTGCLANLTDGGEGCHGRVLSNETKKKISDKAKINFKGDERSIKYS